MRTVLAAAALLFSVAVGFHAPHRLDAGTAVALDLAGLVDGAEWVFEGRVLDASAQRDASGRIETRYRMSVSASFLGGDASERVFRLPGGVLPDGAGMVLPGVPRFVPGEDAIVFLTRESRTGMRMPVGLAQGKLGVVRDALGRRTLARDFAGLEFVTAGGAPLPAAALDYDAARAQIESLCRAKRSRESRSAK
jgi:hypothetical protein